MTHPLITIYARKSKRPSDPENIAELVAAEPIADFSVGFFMGENCRVLFVWMWPLKGRFVEEVQYWIDNLRYEYDFHNARGRRFNPTRFYVEALRDSFW
jgi:hypothetical protein